jgi:hypothetical protein
LRRQFEHSAAHLSIEGKSMKKLFRVLRWLVIVGACCLLIGQVLRPARTNPITDASQSVDSKLQLTPEVAAILDRSCNDCHSNKTRWPWYSNVAPVSWFVINHVNEGRRHLNFSEWGKYDRRDAGGMLREICREVTSGGMPLSSYTPLHPGSSLSETDRKVLCDWANAARARIAAP